MFPHIPLVSLVPQQWWRAESLPPVTCTHTGFLEGVFAGVLVSFHLESLFCLPFIPLTGCLDYIYLYLFFSKAEVIHELQSSALAWVPGARHVLWLAGCSGLLA